MSLKSLPSHGTRLAALASLTLLALPGTALAASHIEVLVGGVSQQDDQGSVFVDLRLLNPGDVADSIILPDRIEARVTDKGSPSPHTVMLSRVDTAGSTLAVPAHEFAQARYRVPVKEASAGAMLTIPAWSTQTIMIEAPTVSRLARNDESPAVAAEAAPPPPSPPVAERQPAPPPTDKTVGNAFLSDLSAYQPIYAVYGPGVDARLQLSFKYKLFGSSSVGKAPADWRQGLHFAYTQRMFWDLNAVSSPFHNIDFQPELIYITPSAVLNNGIALGGQIGLRHESNGRDGTASRSINSFYLAPMAAIPLGDYRMTVSPRVSIYVGDKSDNPDIIRYRGNAGLFWEIGKDDGLRLSTTSRFNFSTGKGSLSADLSYPLPRILGGGPDFYLYLQSFVGYGENLLDYNRYATRLRIGFALVR
ncbi:putative outer membrane phospholipase A [Novosphingobium nitrogenifigens DSM 19370]|uniref:Phospholipase A1 n=1 Tax=Novosphingobium nitrogenifigens DSM 19370 TaxID=983920 RepID=F1Z9R8_9SPHN|nr:phospholipase A [Novosphingobium nitrogenifigens]EGD58674.1 putative outer membrane phospholipase A [Novosphingobium nitrogenifigens DSM 19370]